MVEVAIINKVYQSFYSRECKLLSEGKPLTNSKLTELNPFIDKSGTIRVRGHLKHAKLLYGSKYQIILPKKNSISDISRKRAT